MEPYKTEGQTDRQTDRQIL